MTDPQWREFNRAGWDERVDLHLEVESYDFGPLRSGRGALTPIEEAEIGPVDGLHILHLQCHFGRDTLTLAQRGATVVGLDFSPRAITVARTLAEELGMSDRAHFIEADLYDAPKVLNDVFDLVFVNWGSIGWLPDISRWAEIVAHFIKPGGAPCTRLKAILARRYSIIKKRCRAECQGFYPLLHRGSLAIRPYVRLCVA